MLVFSFGQRNYNTYVKGNYSALVSSLLSSPSSQSTYCLEVENMLPPNFLPLNEERNVNMLWIYFDLPCIV